MKIRTLIARLPEYRKAAAAGVAVVIGLLVQYNASQLLSGQVHHYITLALWALIPIGTILGVAKSAANATPAGPGTPPSPTNTGTFATGGVVTPPTTGSPIASGTVYPMPPTGANGFVMLHVLAIGVLLAVALLLLLAGVYFAAALAVVLILMLVHDHNRGSRARDHHHPTRAVRAIR